MPDEATIEATMQVFHCNREDALKHLAPFESTDEDKEYARFLRDLFISHAGVFNFNRYELKWWRDNKAMAESTSPKWSQKQREWIEERMEIYGAKMVPRDFS